MLMTLNVNATIQIYDQLTRVGRILFAKNTFQRFVEIFREQWKLKFEIFKVESFKWKIFDVHLSGRHGGSFSPHPPHSHSLINGFFRAV